MSCLPNPVNNVSNISDIPTTVNAYQTVSFVFSVMNLVTALFGITSNTASIYVFTRRCMRRCSINRLLTGLAVADLLLLLTAVPVFITPPLLESFQVCYFVFQAYTVKFIYPISMIAQTSSVLTIVAITVERWIAVCNPLKVKQWCSVHKSMWTLVAIQLAAALYNVVRFWEYRVVNDPHYGITLLRNLRSFDDHPFYMVLYFTGAYLITHFLVPFLTIAWLNTQSTIALITMSKQRKRLTRHQRFEHRTTVMMLLVIGSFAVCNTVPFLLNITEALYNDLFHNPNTYVAAYFFNDLGNLLVVFNSSTTAVICFIFSEKYRRQLTLTFTQLTRRNFWEGKTSIFFYSTATTANEATHFRPTRSGYYGSEYNYDVGNGSMIERRHRKVGVGLDDIDNDESFRKEKARNMIKRHEFRKNGTTVCAHLQKCSSANDVTAAALVHNTKLLKVPSLRHGRTMSVRRKTANTVTYSSTEVTINTIESESSVIGEHTVL